MRALLLSLLVACGDNVVPSAPDATVDAKACDTDVPGTCGHPSNTLMDAPGPDALVKCGRNPAQDATCQGSLDYACVDGTDPALSIPGLSCVFEPSDLSYCCL